MTSRFLSNLLVLLAGAFLTAAALGFHTAVLGWLTLAVGAIVTACVLGAFAFRGRGVIQRSLDALCVLGGTWTIVLSRCFAGAALKWLSFSSGALFVALAAAGLLAHELLLELSLRRRGEDPLGRRVSRPEEPAQIRVAG